MTGGGYGPEIGGRSAENERAFIKKILDEYGWNLIKTANAMKISVSRLKELMRKNRLGN